MSAVKRLRTITEQATTWEALLATLDGLPVPAAVLEVERTAIAWNHAAETAFGWSVPEVVGTRLPLVTDAGATELRALLQRALHADTPMRLEVEGRTRSGQTVLLRLAAAALPDFGTGAAQVLVTFEDVTELGRLRRQLHRARTYSRGLADLSPEAMLIVRDGLVGYANMAAARLLGVPRRKLVGAPLQDLVQADPEEIFRLASSPTARDTGATIETRLRRSDEPLDVEIVARPMRFRRQLSFLVLVRDASLRRRLEQELARTQDRFRVLSESVRGHAVVTTDGAGRITSWNGGAERLFGHTAAAIVGQSMAVLFRESDVVAGRPDLELHTTLEVGRFEGEEWRRRADGSEFWAAVTLVPQYGAEQRLIGFTATVHDLTERLEAQEALRRTEEQLRHAQRMEAVGRLTAGVAHDFNNLLTAIRGYAQLLLEDMGDDPRSADLEEIRRAADRGTTLTRQLLAVGRRQAQQAGPLELNGVVLEAEKMLRRIVGEDVVLVTELEEKLGRVNADAAQIEQVLMNLVVNARDAMPRGGQLTISTRNVPPAGEAPHGWVVLAVSDTGVGMDVETQRRLFEPFFTTKPPGQGTGLGLSTVNGIVDQCGGRIDFRSEPGRGTTFEVLLPRVDEPPEPPAARQQQATVLVALHDRMFRQLAIRTLERQGYTVLDARTSSEAVRVAREAGRVDLLLADSAMQGSGGRALVESLAGVCGAPRVLYLADAPGPGSLPGGPDAEVIIAPFTPLALAKRIRSLLDRGMAT